MVNYFTFRIITSSQVKISCWHKLLGPPRSRDSGGLGCAPRICICIKCQSAAAATPCPRMTLREPKSLSSYPILFFSKIMWSKKARMTILTLESRIPFWPSNTISRTLFHRKNYCTLTITALLVKVKNWKQSKCPSVKYQLTEVWYILTN